MLARLLPPPPARVLDVGAGTGILALAAAQLGHTVTAVDLAPAMLERLAAFAADDGLEVSVVNARADELPDGAWDVVTSRHLLWTLPDPAAVLRCWRAAVPGGRLVLLESLWGPLPARSGVAAARPMAGCGRSAATRASTTGTTTRKCGTRSRSPTVPPPNRSSTSWRLRAGAGPAWCASATSSGRCADRASTCKISLAIQPHPRRAVPAVSSHRALIINGRKPAPITANPIARLEAEHQPDHCFETSPRSPVA